MKRILVAFGLMALVAGLFGATALARGHGGPFGRERMKTHISEHIDELLEAINASPEQTGAIRAARDRAFAAIDSGRGDRPADLARAAQLFTADRIDAGAVDALRAEHQTRVRTAADAIVGAVVEAHDVMSPVQRKDAVEYWQAHAPSGGIGPDSPRASFMKRMITHRIDQALDVIKATPAQRTAVYAARDHVVQAISAGAPDRQQMMARVAALFEADRIDTAQLSKLRSDQQAKMAQTGDAFVQALYDVHDALTPAQRVALVDYVKSQRHQ
jgi:Spy/CpxP family protein refolding chaperone